MKSIEMRTIWTSGLVGYSVSTASESAPTRSSELASTITQISFDSAAFHLIAVMDGFVNDFEPDVRRGLASRDPDSMTAWDSVVGHHLGLTNALKDYQKTIKKRVDEEVLELHRHGIVHGAITKFDNVVVATKAWNMLFAVADWATATTKARQPEAPKPTLLGGP